MRKKTTNGLIKVVFMLLLAGSGAVFAAHYYSKKVVTKPLVTCLYGSTTVFDEIADKAVVGPNTIVLYRANGSVMQFVNVSCRVLYPTKDGQYK